MKKMIIGLLALAVGLAAEATVYRAGLVGWYTNAYSSTEATIAGYSNPDLDEVFFSPSAATNRNAACANTAVYPPIWCKNRTWCYHGEMYFNGNAYGFGENMDDMAYLAVDGTREMYNTQNNVFNGKRIRPSQGWHTIKILLGNTNLNAIGGYANEDATCEDKNGLRTGFAFSDNWTPGSNPTSMNELVYPVDSGDGSLFRHVLPVLTLVRYTVITRTATGYSVFVTPLSSFALDLSVSLGTADGVKTVTSSQQTVQPGDVGVFDLAWSGSDVPYVMTSAVGNDGKAKCWEDTDPYPADSDVTLSTVSVSAPSTVIENDWREKEIVISRLSQDAWQAITVNLSYTGNRADFSTLPDTVALAVGETTKRIPFTTVDNSDSEGDRTFVVAVAAGTGYIASSQSSVSMAVVDDETSAATCEWTGGGDGATWADSENWSLHRVPRMIDTVLFGDSVSANLSVAVNGETTARRIQITTDKTITLTGTFRPFDIEMAEGSKQLTLNGNTTELQFDQDIVVTVAEDAVVNVGTCSGTGAITKLGPGKMNFTAVANRTRTGAFYISAGFVDFNLHNCNSLGSPIVVGGGTESASLVWNYSGQYARDAFLSSNVINVKTNGTLDLSYYRDSSISQLRTLGAVTIEAGGRFLSGGDLVLNDATGCLLTLEGSVTSKDQSCLSLGRSGVLIPSTRTEALTWLGQFRGDPYGRKQAYTPVVVEDIPGVAVDALFAGELKNGYFDKQGDGVMQVTATNSAYARPTKVSAGTLLADNKSGSATGKGAVSVEGSGTLGGVGTVGGLESSPDATLAVASTSETGYATVHPGSIDAATGAHIPGTLTAGSAVQSCATTFGNRSRLKISVGNGVADQLRVYGKVTISGEDNLIEIAANGEGTESVRDGTYRILSATGGIEGSFARVVRPAMGWKVFPVMGEGAQASDVVALDLVIKRGLAIILR